MEQINIEDIMGEIRENIKERGYTKKDLKFADIEVLSPGDMKGEFDINTFKACLHETYQSRGVQSYRSLTSSIPVVGFLVKFVKRVIRKLLCFYIEPIVEDQNKVNDNITRNMSQVSTKFDNDAETIKELEARIDELEVTCRKMQKILEDAQKNVSGNEE